MLKCTYRILPLIFVAVFFACVDENNDSPDLTGIPEAGVLSVYYQNSFRTSEDTLEILLDTLKATTNTNLQFSNKGLEDIRNLQISLNDTNSLITPVLIKKFPGQKYVPGMEQKIQLKIMHGQWLIAGKIAIYQKPGWNHLLMSLNGTSKNKDTDSVPVEMHIRFNYFAQIADFEIFQDDSVINLNTSEESVEGPDKVTSVYTFNYRNANSYKLKNTGNTTLSYTVINGNTYFNELKRDTLSPDELHNIPLPLQSDTSKVFIRINSQQVVQNIRKKLVYNNGNSYILLKNLKQNK